jgi:hypothetical protein
VPPPVQVLSAAEALPAASVRESAATAARQDFPRETPAMRLAIFVWVFVVFMIVTFMGWIF